MFTCKHAQKPHSWESVFPIWLNSVTLCPWSRSVNVLLGECEVLPSEPQRQKREQILSWTFLISPRLPSYPVMVFAGPKFKGIKLTPPTWFSTAATRIFYPFFSLTPKHAKTLLYLPYPTKSSSLFPSFKKRSHRTQRWREEKRCCCRSQI